ncbi:ATP-binding protein [Streptomyces erythrochromogenes]|uniref:sensor histidine kinase n=1 Tax=Streptomyces erythrochromogenes TaxID=285574 RepID=UPI003417E3A5
MGSSTDGGPAGPAPAGAGPGPAPGPAPGPEPFRTADLLPRPRRRAARPIDVPHIEEADARLAPVAVPGGPALQRTYSGGGLADVQTSHRADVTRIAAWLRVGFLGVLALASFLEHPGGPQPLPFPEAVVLAAYGALVLATTVARRRPAAPRRYARFAAGMLWADIATVVVLQLFSDGSPPLALSLFLIPMSAGFQLPVRQTTVIAGASLTAYLALLALDPQLRARTVDENTIAVLAFFVLACLACLVVARQYQRKQHRIHQLVCERAHLLAEVMGVEERERAALAQLLHDGPLQSVLAVRLELGTAQRLAPPDAIATARVRLLDISRQLRDLTTALHPFMLETKGIGHVLRLLAENTAERADLAGDCAVAVRHDPEDPDPREALVFNAARELLNNVVLHARATRFSLSLAEDSGVWRLEVRDDGTGIAPGELRGKLHDGHIGLAGLRIRTEAAHGTLTITSGPQGTSVVISLPPQDR